MSTERTTAARRLCPQCGKPEHGDVACMAPNPLSRYVVAPALPPIIYQAPRKRVNVARTSKGYSVEGTVDVYNGEYDDAIMEMLGSLITRPETTYPREVS